MLLAYLFHRDDQHFRRIAIAIGRTVIRKQLANVTESHGSQDGVGDSMQEHVGVAMPDHVVVMGNFDTAQAQRAAGFQTVRVVSDADAHDIDGERVTTVNKSSAAGFYS